MNMMDSAFLCLDIGTAGVRGIAHRIKNAQIDHSAYYSIDDFDTVFALKSVIDELEKQIGTRFDTAYITGNFGSAYFTMTPQSTIWGNEHKITAADIKSQIASIHAPEGFYPLHIIPLRYDTPKIRNMLSPIGHTDRQLVSAFAALFFDNEYMQKFLTNLRHAHIQPAAFYAPHFLMNETMNNNKETLVFIDFGAENTTTSIWTRRGPVFFDVCKIGGNDLTHDLSTRLDIPFSESEKIKLRVADMRANDMARFSPADSAYAFSCAEVNDIIVPFLTNLVQDIKNKAQTYIEKYNPSKIILTGGITKIPGFYEFMVNMFDLPIDVCDSDATVRALSEYIWQANADHRKKYIGRLERWESILDKVFRIFHRRKKKNKKIFIPIMPSSLCFDMNAPETYSMFYSGGISAIHVDIMDGFYVDRIAGSIDELRHIRESWTGHLHVHLMTEAPSEWARDAIGAGADTVILSTNTAGLRNAIQIAHNANKRVGIALNPESSITLLKTVLRELDEVMIMAVKPGAAGQMFDKSVLKKISVLNATRKKYGLKFIISVDGGINAETAPLCWDAGADILVSGSYLASAPDFPLAVQSLLKKQPSE